MLFKTLKKLLLYCFFFSKKFFFCLLQGKNRKEVPCSIRGVSRESLDTALEKVEWTLRILDRNTDILGVKIAEAISERKGL